MEYVDDNYHNDLSLDGKRTLTFLDLINAGLTRAAASASIKG